MHSTNSSSCSCNCNCSCSLGEEVAVTQVRRCLYLCLCLCLLGLDLSLGLGLSDGAIDKVFLNGEKKKRCEATADEIRFLYYSSHDVWAYSRYFLRQANCEISNQDGCNFPRLLLHGTIAFFTLP